MADRFNSKISDENGYSNAAALFFYDSGSGYENITQHLKYEGGIKSGRYFAGILADKIMDGGLFNDVDCIIPVPLHWRRKWKRGYNQAEIIAEVLASRLGAKLVSDALVRKKYTKTQTAVRVEAKTKNVEGAFELVHPVNASHILLVDDVFTSGATLAECQKAIRQKTGLECRISVATLACVGE